MIKNVIEVHNLIKTYQTGDTSFNALNNVSLTVKKGEFVAIMGASGSGKSTFMNQIGCLDKPTSGKYFLDGIDVSTMSSDELAVIRNRKLGFVFQGFNLISRTTALDNVQLPMIYAGIKESERIERARAALKIVGLEKRENHLPNQMSGGQQQRVAIARAIVNDAPIILADEPTGNLDTKTSIEVMEFFVNLNEKHGKTIVLVTHEPDIAEYCKRVVKFKDGNIESDIVKRF
ncbi:MAG: ABC transporter ATP-binding protein [Candidatus Gastranaerophilaceae bacterium]